MAKRLLHNPTEFQIPVVIDTLDEPKSVCIMPKRVIELKEDEDVSSSTLSQFPKLRVIVQEDAVEAEPAPEANED